MQPRQWHALTITLTAPVADDAWESFQALVHYQLDALGCEELHDRPIPSPEDPKKLRFFFPEVAPTDLEVQFRALAAMTLPAGSFEIRRESILDEDWGVKWRDYFKTRRVGERLYVGPPWEGSLPADAPAGALLVLIEPGQAFGTGSHETTQLCLQLLEKYLIPGGCLLDVGTGSGILGIGAIKLGEGAVLGVEYDPVCEENFELNARLNGVEGRMHFILSPDPAAAVALAAERGLPAPDHIVCNMLAERFKPLLPALRSIGKPLLLSGFLIAEETGVREAVEAVGLRIKASYRLEEWGAFYCESAAS